MSTTVDPRVVRAFQRLFGHDESKRNPDQKLVWEALKQASYFEKPCFVPQIQHHPVMTQDGTDKELVPVGQTYDPYAAASTDGMRRMFIYIKSMAVDAAIGITEE